MRKFVALFLLCGLASLASAQSDTAAPTIEQVEAQIKQAEQAAARGVDTVQAGAPRFKDVGDAFIVDRQTGLAWTQADNGADTNWDDAQRWCKSKGTQLPNMVELGGLFDSALRRVSCGDNKCQVSALFQLTGSWFWSAEQENSSEAKIFGFQNGFRVSNRFESTKGKRALCVKRSHL